MSAVLVVALASGPAAADRLGVAGTMGVRMPLMDLADPLPWTGRNPPMGAARLDVMPGLMVHDAMGWEVELRGRLSGYAMMWPDESIAPGHRGAVELSVRRFVPPHDYRTEQGIWEGGYAGGSVAAEVWGRHPLGAPKLATAHFMLGYLALAGDITPSFLEVGYGVWGDGLDGTSGHGPAVRAGAYLAWPWAGEGSIAPKSPTDRD